ncbi:hypothetical protein OIV83_000827 [Microbotryomycetes sp. JL201]|nr:hypothetical protein OIV83_000827 [Microbotryomycetes sp. JL201]
MEGNKGELEAMTVPKADTGADRRDNNKQHNKQLFQGIVFYVEGSFQGHTNSRVSGTERVVGRAVIASALIQLVCWGPVRVQADLEMSRIGQVKKLITDHGGKVTPRIDKDMPDHIIVSGHLWHRESTRAGSMLIANIKEANKQTRMSNREPGAEDHSSDNEERTWILSLDWVLESIAKGALEPEVDYDFERVEKARKVAVKKRSKIVPEAEKGTAPTIKSMSTREVKGQPPRYQKQGKLSFAGTSKTAEHTTNPTPEQKNPGDTEHSIKTEQGEQNDEGVTAASVDKGASTIAAKVEPAPEIEQVAVSLDPRQALDEEFFDQLDKQIKDSIRQRQQLKQELQAVTRDTSRADAELSEIVLDSEVDELDLTEDVLMK